MFLSRLKLTQFKNYSAQEFEFSPRLNCLTGLNGVGKTNVLDAIHFLCLCRNHTGLNDRNLVLHEAGFFRLEGRFEAEGKPVKITAKYESGKRKEFARNGKTYERLSQYIGQYPVVMIAPDDVALVQEGSEDRRRFLDTTLSQISAEYLQQLLIYNALLKQRNALLRQFAEQRYFDDTLLESIDRQMPAPAALIVAERQRFVERFQPIFRQYYESISGGKEQVDALYETDLQESGLDELLKQTLEKDRILQRTTRGPHRDDLELLMNGQALKKFASQGQLKSYLLALRLAQYEVLRIEKNTAPILLLDDIFDKLDARRVSQLIALLIEKDFGQIFITDTQRERMEAVIAPLRASCKLFEIEARDGEVLVL